jgi:serine/threonine protein phosphatase PrpC
MDLFKRIFGKKKPAVSPDGVKTAPLDPMAVAPTIVTPLLGRVLVGMAQSTGIERTHNEDSLFVLQGNAAGLEALPEFGLYIVADGMGGHRSGEVASAISVRAVSRRLFEDSILQLMSIDPLTDVVPLQDLMRTALEEANLAVVERVPGGGTTLTAVLHLGHQITIGHVGDSRAYILTDSEARPITRDHSLVKRLEELGQLRPEEAEVHPQRNVLYRAIGQGANLEVDVFTLPIPRDSHLLLCSDGLWGVVPDQEIRRIVSSAESPQKACDRLIDAANAAGGPDNISAVLIYFPPE